MKLKQEIPHILTIAVRRIIHACIRNLKYSNTDVQQKNVSKKKGINLVVIWVFFILFSEKRNSGLYFCFIIKTCEQNVSKAATEGILQEIFKISENLQKTISVGVPFLIKLQISGLQLKTPTQLFSSEF